MIHMGQTISEIDDDEAVLKFIKEKLLCDIEVKDAATTIQRLQQKLGTEQCTSCQFLLRKVDALPTLTEFTKKEQQLEQLTVQKNSDLDAKNREIQAMQQEIEAMQHKIQAMQHEIQTMEQEIQATEQETLLLRETVAKFRLKSLKPSYDQTYVDNLKTEHAQIETFLRTEWERERNQMQQNQREKTEKHEMEKQKLETKIKHQNKVIASMYTAEYIDRLTTIHVCEKKLWRTRLSQTPEHPADAKEVFQRLRKTA